jgi:hypothetical protein
MIKHPKAPEDPSLARGVVVVDAPHAPIIYFDGAPNFGNNNGIVNVTLATSRHLGNAAGGVTSDVLAVAHLRCTVQAAINLRKAIDDALLLGAPVDGEGDPN